MAVAQWDLASLRGELARLEERERELSTLRRKLHDRIDNGFPNDAVRAREREVSAERRALHGRIDRLRVTLGDALGR